MKHRAFTLIEMLVAVSIVLILISAMITVTGHLKNEARKRLTASALGVIATALEQYYENTSPKQFPLQVSNQSDFEIALFGNPPSDTVGIVGTGFPIPDADPLTDDPGTVFWRSASLYYFLNRTTQSRAIVESLSNQMLSNKYDGIATLIRRIAYVL
jgi:prepilin-type N-terminal cleavage/methylation domain-containing protein